MAADAKPLDGERWQDRETERLVLGDILLTPGHASPYREAGCTAEHFADPYHRRPRWTPKTGH